MNAQEIWSIAKSIIASVGGAGIMICAVSGFISARLAKRLDAKYEQRLGRELAKFESQLERHRYVSKGILISEVITTSVIGRINIDNIDFTLMGFL